MSFRRGEVVLVLFPDSNLRTAKRRPSLVVQAENPSTGLAQTIVAMVTSNLARGGHPSRVLLTADGEVRRRAGLLMDSIVMKDNLATVLDSEIDRVIGVVEDMTPVDQALRTTLGL
jgi:mRNA interferase MazF